MVPWEGLDESTLELEISVVKISVELPELRDSCDVVLMDEFHPQGPEGDNEELRAERDSLRVAKLRDDREEITSVTTT